MTTSRGMIARPVRLNSLTLSTTDIVQLCQDWVDANVDAGDSFSPVFRITNNPARRDVSLYGILWGGGRPPGYGTVFVFSSLSGKNLQRKDELGGLTTCASAFHC